MTKVIKLTLFVFSIVLFTEVSAQTVYFSGVGRALVTANQLKDNTKQDSKEKASAGYTMFDLGIYAKPNEVLKGGVILRVKNSYGGFYGDGASLQFRQMQMEGLIAKKVKYEIGDIYLTHTKYTMWNQDFIDHQYEANVFSLRRDIVNYENFFVGNAWRMQGVNLKTQLNFSKRIESLGIRAYGGRTATTNFTTIPDRYFYGGSLNLKQGKVFRIAGNVACLSDISGTVPNTQVFYSNIAYTTDFDVTIDKSDKFKFVFSGEAGGSHFEMTRAADSSANIFDDFFYDAGIKATYKPLDLNVGLSFRDVGFNFNSPMAQTRRVATPSDITLSTMSTLNDGTTLRPFSIYDAYSQENNLYNQAISATLMNYFVQYNMVEPYGKATPNRRGFTVTADIKDAKNIINAGVEFNLLSEGVSEGDSITFAKRKLNLFRGGLVFNLNKVLNFEKVIAINAGLRTESSNRTGTNPLSLASSMIDLGLDVEVIKNLHLLGGLKLFSVKGNEVQSGRDDMNQIVSFGSVNFNQTQSVIAPGLRYNYDEQGYFSMHYHIVKYNDQETAWQKYNLNQLFFVFGLKF